MIINERTFKDVYNDYFETICRFLNYYTRDYQVIEEVVQDVFVCLWEDYEGQEIQYIKTFLYNSARNRMLNYLRDEDNHTVLLEKWARIELEKNESVDCVDRELFYQLLQAAVGSLPEKCREIFILSREEQLSYKEIAVVKEISVKTVENQMGIALKKIREYIAAHSDESVMIILLSLLSKNY
ncbi:RNA polymerase sigma-70 factor [Parabacteroides sp. AF18-52]|jgi:RNA polymerase sigma-70 factor|uniref:RNA polymerase sigma-70 factor n=1 Tax=Parabacteroides TaxID=375288 RepID=UPI000EFE7E75|nr:RNA polymerase sigma-70 factor [Parabacteroides sp. AF18-52]RHR36395.1 RNA polymerase sigma-70 factor [Parabacteroides sp. AF18-52]